MYEQDKAILMGLVSVAWSDGTFAEREKEMLDALLESFGANDDEKKELQSYAETKRGIEDIPLTELSYGDRRNLMQHAVALSWIDGDQADSEVAFLDSLRQHMRISDEEWQEISSVATARAKDLLKLLDEEDAPS